MRFRGTHNPGFGNGSGWQRWFAWYPVKLQEENTWVWLEYVDRQMFCAFGGCTVYYRSPSPSA